MHLGGVEPLDEVSEGGHRDLLLVQADLLPAPPPEQYEHRLLSRVVIPDPCRFYTGDPDPIAHVDSV